MAKVLLFLHLYKSFTKKVIDNGARCLIEHLTPFILTSYFLPLTSYFLPLTSILNTNEVAKSNFLGQVMTRPSGV